MFWVLLALIIVTYIVNKISLHYGFDDLSYDMEIGKRIGEIGEEIEFISVIENNKILTVSFLKIEERFPKGFSITENVYNLFIMPYQRVRRTHIMSVNKRGYYPIDNIILTLGDFIGLNIKRKIANLDTGIIILPERIDLKESIAPLGSFTGDISVKRWILDDPLMTIGIREYTGYEPEKYIHWPSFLRYGELMVRNFDFTSDNSVMVALNLETMKPSWKPAEAELIERVISVARSILEEFEKNKIPYGFASNANISGQGYRRGCFSHPGLGSNHLEQTLEKLGRMNYKLPAFFENTIKDMGKIKANYSTLVIITPRILESYIEPINSISQTINNTVVISIEDEYLEKLNKNIRKYRGI